MRPLAFVLAFLLLGCARTPDLTGTWHSSLGGAFTTYHFWKDGRFALECDYAGYHASVSGKYKLAGGQIELDPEATHVDGSGPRAGELEGQLSQMSRVTIRAESPMSYRLGLDEPPLIMHRMSPNP